MPEPVTLILNDVELQRRLPIGPHPGGVGSAEARRPGRGGIDPPRSTTSPTAPAPGERQKRNLGHQVRWVTGLADPGKLFVDDRSPAGWLRWHRGRGLMALQHGVVPTINHGAPDPDCDLDVVPSRPGIRHWERAVQLLWLRRPQRAPAWLSLPAHVVPSKSLTFPLNTTVAAPRPRHALHQRPRMLAVDAINKSNNGHPACRWAAHPWVTPSGNSQASLRLVVQPRPLVLSAGHNCMLFCAVHLTGYDSVSIEHQAVPPVGLKDPGHPETFETP